MDDISTQPQREILRERLSRFVTRASPWRAALQDVLEMTQKREWSVFVFGGTLRDLLAVSAMAVPRDLDLVVSGPTGKELREVFAPQVVRETRFGGLHLHVRKLPVDIWTIESTWAFREGRVSGQDFEALPKTTFLNVEAITAELSATSGRARRIYSHGFFEAIRDRLLEINLEDNPYPALCVVRSLITARQLDFAMGPRLIQYLHHHGSRIALEEMEAVQRAHYGHVRLDREQLHSLLGLVFQHVGSSSRAQLRLPPPTHQHDWYSALHVSDQ